MGSMVTDKTMLKVYENGEPVTVPQTQDLPLDQILIEGLVLDGHIGLFDHEYGRIQPIRFDVTVDIAQLSGDVNPDTKNIVRYDLIVADIKAILKAGHVDLVETLAELVASACLAYPRAQKVVVTVAKPDAFAEAHGVGIRITRVK